MRLLVLCSFLCVFEVSSKGLKEAFTWTRISYDWPKNGQMLKRQAPVESRYKGSGGGMGSDAIVFDGLTNGGERLPALKAPDTLNQENVQATIEYIYGKLD